MSNPASEKGHIEQEEDNPEVGKVVAVAALAVVIFAASIVWSASILHSAPEVTGSAAEPPADLGRPQVGIVFQTPFDDDVIARPRERQYERLSTYGFTDRDAGLIHIPIERAMELLAGQGPR